MNNLSLLKYTLRVFGIAFILIIPMMKLDPLGGWAWSPEIGRASCRERV